MRLRWLALALAFAVVAPPASARGVKKDKKAQKAPKDDEGADDSDEDTKPKAKAEKADKKDKDESSDDEGSDGSDEDEGGGKGKGDEGGDSGKAKPAPKTEEVMQKQDLTGHDLGTKKKTTQFERDRFFVDKSDSEKTEDATLIQGSLTSSSFAYVESGGDLPTTGMTTPTPGKESAAFSRMFTDLRLQTDFRHIKGSRWEARIDARARLVNSPSAPTGTVAVPDPHPQSGLTGQNEYDIRELWLIRNGERTDLIFGRQYITDLAAIKIDGLRFDYASSSKFTLFGFGGMYPLRGSRSITTDYISIKDPMTGASTSTYVAATGGGAAYRTQNAYGAFGGVALVPLEKEQPRVFGTASGYYRLGPKLDLYHFALVDLVSQYGGLIEPKDGGPALGITNLSGGVNYKPSQRLRMTASFNRVDTDTLNIQAQAFLDQQQQNPVVQNEILISRLATNEGRGSISAGLGNLERFEVTTAMAYRYRPSFSLTPVGGTTGTTVEAAKSVEVYGSITDRRSIKDMRIGVDAVQTFGVGNVAYQRNELFALRGFFGRELESGKGEWEGEVAYATNKDTNAGYMCMNFADCYGQTNSSVLSAGGTLYYRFNRDWFMIGQLYLTHLALTVAGQAGDPAINSFSGYFRIAYRF